MACGARSGLKRQALRKFAGAHEEAKWPVEPVRV